MNTNKIFFFAIVFFNLFFTYLSSNENMKNKIYKNLRCLVCQGQSIADSNSDYALTVKSVVDDKINEGLGEKEIYNFLSDKYGDWILYDPPLKPKTFLLWVLPYLFFVFGALVLFLLIKKNLKT
tara:strand:- start:28 stop:399 length:372 start_codon:yes stop_codon:yes gene_type:complete